MVLREGNKCVPSRRMRARGLAQPSLWSPGDLDVDGPPEVSSDKAPGAREKCLPPPAEERPQGRSASDREKQVMEDKAKAQSPGEAERAPPHNTREYLGFVIHLTNACEGNMRNLETENSL
jgi:hypothetical protein